MTRRAWSRRFAKAKSIPCGRVREAISAELDSEAAGLHVKDVRFHLAQCGECFRFEAAARSLSSQVALQVTPPVPADFKDRLARELDVTVAAASHHRGPPSWRLGRTWEWRRGVRWAGALAPAALAVVVLPLGALSTPPEVPTHAATPCTISLRYLHWKNPAIFVTPDGAKQRPS
jgi:hypothetical protein